MAGGNIIRFGAYLDDQVSKKLTGIRGAFDGLANNKGVGLLAQGFGMGAGIGVWNLASQAIGRATDFIKGSIDAASNLNETVTKSQQIFGPAFADIEKWAETAADSFGQSKRQALDTASTFAGLFDTVGVAADESAGMAKRMTELGSDLASFFNTDVQSAIGAIRSGLAGESEPLRRFNVFLSETAVQAKAAELGLTKAGQKLTENAKIQARYAIILDQTKTAQGDFARTSDGLANSQRSLTAQLEDAQAKLGEGLLPAVLAVTKAFSDLLSIVTQTDDAFDHFSKTAETAGAGWLASLLKIVPGGQLAFAAMTQVAGGAENVENGLSLLDRQLAGTRNALDTSAQRSRLFAYELNQAAKDAARAGRDIGEGLTTAVDGVKKRMAEAATAARAGGLAMAKAAADGIRSARGEIDSALDQLAIDVANAMNKQAEIGRLGGLLTGKEIADGLISEDEGVAASANYVASLIEARLDELTEGAYTRGKRAALALAAGFAEKLPANLRSELRDVVEAAKEYEAIKVTFSKPAGSGARLLASNLDAVAKSGSAAASSIRDVRAALGEAVAPLSQAKSLLAQFVAASGSYVDFSPKLMTTEQAAARVATVLGRVNSAIRNLRTSSSGSLSAVASAFDRLKAVAMDYFDAVHRANLRQIEDARMAAMAQYDAQITAINAGVEAYRAELEAKRQARQEEQLKEALANAETPEEVKSAQEALTDFYEQQHLQRLEDQARAQITALETQRAADSKMYDAQVEAENQRYEQQRSAYERLTALLTESLDKMKGVWGSKQEEILKLLASFVGPFGAAGQALVNAFQGAISGATAGAGATVGAAPRVTSPGTLDQADIDALNKYIGNLQAIDDRTAEQQAKLDLYLDRLGDYQERLAGTRATGGPVLPGRTYLVGESGPEYLTMGGSGGYVSPNYGQPVVIQLTVDGRELARVVDKRLYAVYRSTGS